MRDEDNGESSPAGRQPPEKVVDVGGKLVVCTYSSVVETEQGRSQKWHGIRATLWARDGIHQNWTQGRASVGWWTLAPKTATTDQRRPSESGSGMVVLAVNNPNVDEEQEDASPSSIQGETNQEMKLSPRKWTSRICVWVWYNW